MAVMLTAPFVLLAMAQAKADGLIWLMFPIFFFIPVLLSCLLLFAPFEALVAKLGINANIALPVFGAVLGAVVVVIAFKTSKNPQVIERMLSGDAPTLAAATGIVLMGAVVAGAWRLSLWALKTVGWA